MPNSGQTTRTIVWAVVILFVAVLVAVVLLAIYAGDKAEVLVTTILAQVAGLVAILANLQRTRAVEEQVQVVADDTYALRNGLLDAKVRAGVAEVLPDQLHDPEYDPEPDLEAAQEGRERAKSIREDVGQWPPSS